MFRNGLAKTPKQARQLIAHGFIAINGRKVKSAGYMVTADEETRIGYYKPFDLNPEQPEAKPISDSRRAQGAGACGQRGMIIMPGKKKSEGKAAKQQEQQKQQETKKENISYENVAIEAQQKYTPKATRWGSRTSIHPRKTR